MPSRTARLLAPLRSGRRQWWVAFLLFATLSGLWALATPLFGSPDEPAHAIRAASVARLELLGRAPKGSKDGRLIVHVPAIMGQANFVGCYAFKREVPASCFTYDGSEREGDVITLSGKHPPAYFFVAGLPTLVTGGARAVYGMRLMTLLTASALLASAVVSLAALPNPRVALLGLAVAVTPMVLFVHAVVNPSAWEIAGAIGTWAAGILLVHQARAGLVSGRVVARFAIAASVFVLSRQLSPLWLGLVVAALAVLAGGVGLRTLVRSRAVLLGAAAVVVCTIVQLAWLVIVKPLEATKNVSDMSQSTIWRSVVGRSGFFLNGMIGFFGWLDTPAPQVVLLVWTGAICLLLALAIAFAPVRTVLVLIGVTAAAVLIPILAEGRQVETAGFFWQGRYTIPLAVGIPLVASYALATSSIGARLAASRLAAVGGIALGALQVLSFAQALRRYTVGYDGSLFFWRRAAWGPPGGAALLTLAFTVTVVLYMVWLLGPRADDGVEPDTADDPVTLTGARHAPVAAARA